MNDNINSRAATAYVCLDYTGSGKDNYVQISNNKDSGYIGFGEDSKVGYDNIYFSSGIFNNTEYDSEEKVVVLDDVGVGEYVQRSGGKICSTPLECTTYGKPFGLARINYDIDIVNKIIYAFRLNFFQTA